MQGAKRKWSNCLLLNKTIFTYFVKPTPATYTLLVISFPPLLLFFSSSIKTIFSKYQICQTERWLVTNEQNLFIISLCHSSRLLRLFLTQKTSKGSLLHLIHTIVCEHTSTCATSLMCAKNSTHHFCLW